MAIKKYTTTAAYAADTQSSTESTVSHIEEDNSVKVDGVNVITTEPQVGDAVMIDENKKVRFLSAEGLNVSLIPTTWTHVGEVHKREGRDVYLCDKTEFAERLLNVSLYRLTGFTLDGEEHTATINLRLRPNFANYTAIPITYSGTTLAEVIPDVTAALEAVCAEVGETDAAWARLSNDGNAIIVQLDDFSEYRRYQCTASGLTISFVSWTENGVGEYPAITSCGEMLCGKFGVTVISVPRAVIYYGASGTTPTADIPVGSEQVLVTKSAFESSEFCADLRAEYGDYKTFIASFLPRLPQRFGVFSKPDEYWGQTYGNVTVPTKDGGTKALYGFAAKGAQFGYDADGLRVGDWYSNGPLTLIEMNDEETIAKVNNTRAKFGLPAISNYVTRWCCVRSIVYAGWIQYGTNGAFAYGYSAAVRCSGFVVSHYKLD